MKEKKKIDQIMDELENIQPVTPEESFILKMETLSESFFKETRSVPRITLYSIAASFILLIFANFLMLNQALGSSELAVEDVQIIEYEYDLIPGNKLNYE